MLPLPNQPRGFGAIDGREHAMSTIFMDLNRIQIAGFQDRVSNRSRADAAPRRSRSVPLAQDRGGLRRHAGLERPVSIAAPFEAAPSPSLWNILFGLSG
jgi:hypothetical protein